MRPASTARKRGRRRKDSVDARSRDHRPDERPGTVLPILTEELEDFETEATRFLAGGYEEEAVFQGYRLKQGVYGQRQAKRCR